MPSLRTLEPWLYPYADWIWRVGKYYDRRLVVTSARRSSTDQARLYARYLRGESRLPAAPPGSSAHEFGLAFDLARLGVDASTDPFLLALGRLWQSYGGKHGGGADPVHFGI